ncbi:hypothetical protein [Streptomyces sp. NPDC058620]|uniref:hypothetical protein n=1 Tax=Streptomyces sp. NPDC058620 TaxID=3346560 RepID=UPI00365000DB
MGGGVFLDQDEQFDLVHVIEAAELAQAGLLLEFRPCGRAALAGCLLQRSSDGRGELRHLLCACFAESAFLVFGQFPLGGLAHLCPCPFVGFALSFSFSSLALYLPRPRPVTPPASTHHKAVHLE